MDTGYKHEHVCPYHKIRQIHVHFTLFKNWNLTKLELNGLWELGKNKCSCIWSPAYLNNTYDWY